MNGKGLKRLLLVSLIPAETILVINGCQFPEMIKYPTKEPPHFSKL